MSFIPLTQKNFVVNKVQNTIKVEYKDTDIETHVCDKTIDSKSLVNTNNFVGITNSECNISDEDNLANSKRNRIKAFYSNISDNNMSAESYFEAKQALNEASIYNQNIKDFNFKNYFKVERIDQKFLPNSFELQKKNIVKNSLYKDYSENYSLDYYRDLNQGFCNYNSINFFSQRLDETINHSNCLMWPNPYYEDKHLYNLYDSNLTLSFYVNLRKNYNDYTKPECLLHIPRLISLYLVRSIDANNGHRICIVSGDNTFKSIKTINSSIFNSSSRNINDQLGTYVSSDLNIENNKWYNICLNLNKNVDNSREIEIFIDGSSVDKFDISFQNNTEVNTHSFICLGNKPEYFNRETDVYKTDLDKIFYQFFGAKYNNDKPTAGPSIIKDLSLGRSNWVENGQYSIETIISNDEGVNFEARISQDSEAFHGEVHDLRIYLQNIDEEKIKNICANTISDLNNEVDNFSLCFYLPVFYINDYVHKRTSINANATKLNTYYSCLYNPFLSSTCGALEMSAESFLIDFVNLTKPNIVIGGFEYRNTYDDSTNYSLSSLISTSSDSSDIKKGYLGARIYNKNISNTSHQFFDINKNNNLTYRNLLLLPNDNGIPKVEFDLINQLDNTIIRSESLSIYDYHISTVDIIDKELHNATLSNSIVDNNSISFNINLSNELSYDFSFSNDLLYNVSNIIYHDVRVNDTSNLSSLDNELFNKKVQEVRDYFNYSDSNPVIRNYSQDPNTFRIQSDDILKEESTYLENVNIKYLNLPLPYSVCNIDYDCIFNTIFDVSSKLYNKKINKNTLELKDNSLAATNNNVSLTFKDNGYGALYRSDCLTEVAKWNYVGHSFYKEGIISLNRPESCYFGVDDFELKFETDFSMYVHEINIPAEAGKLNKSNNKTYNSNLRHDQSAFNSESSFVYITDINLHDENLNIIAKAKLARPAPKKNEDNILFKLKMDY